MGAIFYIYSLSTILICFLVIDLCYIHNRCIIYHKNGIFNAKSIFKGSSRAKIYSGFKYGNFGSLTGPEAFIIYYVILQWNTIPKGYSHVCNVISYN